MAYYSSTPNALPGPEQALADTLPPALRAAVEAELADGERLLWAGQPDGKRLAVSSLPVLVFGIPWTAFSLFWTASAFWMTRSSGTPEFVRWFFPLFGFPFVLIGFGMLASPVFAKGKARATVYAVTDRRVLVVTDAGRGRRGVEAFVPQVGAGLKRRDTGGGRGDLTLPRPFGGSMRYVGGAGRTLQANAQQGDSVVFYGIRDAAGVERLVRETFEFVSAPAYGGAPAGGVGALPAHLGGGVPVAASDRPRRPYGEDDVAAPALVTAGAAEFPPPPYAADRPDR